MSRKSERAILGLLGFIGALVALVVGVQLLAEGGAVDVAAGSIGGTEAVSPASPVNDSSGDAALAPGSLMVSTTEASSVSTSTSAPDASVETTAPADGGDTSTSSSTSASSADGDSTTSTSPATTATSDGTGSSTTSTSDPSTSETQAGSPPSTAANPELTDIEREIIRLTNELRTNPSGPERRVGPMPECVSNDDDIEVDRETGHPKPVRALTPSQSVSIAMSRDWSQQMADADTMTHRSGESQDSIYAELGIDWAARGENVAWAVGYDLSDVARLFFRGWRESDGHYCNMMSGAFTEIGVGHVRTDGGKDFATQNFYRPR